MINLTLSIDENKLDKLKQIAKNSDKSIQSVICDLIESLPYLPDDENVDLFNDPIYTMEGYDIDAPSDLSKNADKYIY